MFVDVPVSTSVRTIMDAYCRAHAVPMAGSAARETLIQRIYLQVHCRLDPDRERWSQQARALQYLQQAQALPIRPARQHRFVSLEPTSSADPVNAFDSVLIDSDGIRVRLPAQAEVEPDGTARRLAAPALALLQEGRWLQWTAPEMVMRQVPDPMRIYLNVRPESVYDAWSALVLAADRAQVQLATKMITSKQEGERADSVVMLGSAATGSAVLGLVQAALQPDWLSDPVAGFSVPVMRGVGVGMGNGLVDNGFGLGWATDLVDALIQGPQELQAALARLERACAPEALAGISL